MCACAVETEPGEVDPGRQVSRMHTIALTLCGLRVVFRRRVTRSHYLATRFACRDCIMCVVQYATMRDERTKDAASRWRFVIDRAARIARWC